MCAVFAMIAESGEFYSTLCAVFWAIAVILFRLSGGTVTPIALNLFKNVFSFVLFAITIVTIGLPVGGDPSDLTILFFSGVLGLGIGDTLFFASLNRLGAGRSAIVDCLYSPAVLLCSALWLDEPIGYTLIVAIILMVIAIFIGTSGESRVHITSRQLTTGVVFGVLAMLVVAVGIVWAKPVLARVNLLFATEVRLVGGLVFLLPLGLARYRETASAFIPGPHWKFMLPGSFIGAYLSMITWMAGMKYTYTVTASVLNQLSNVFVLILAAVFLREQLKARHYMAIMLGFTAGAIAYM